MLSLCNNLETTLVPLRCEGKDAVEGQDQTGDTPGLLLLKAVFFPRPKILTLHWASSAHQLPSHSASSARMSLSLMPVHCVLCSCLPSPQFISHPFLGADVPREPSCPSLPWHSLLQMTRLSPVVASHPFDLKRKDFPHWIFLMVMQLVSWTYLTNVFLITRDGGGGGGEDQPFIVDGGQCCS